MQSIAQASAVLFGWYLVLMLDMDNGAGAVVVTM